MSSEVLNRPRDALNNRWHYATAPKNICNLIAGCKVPECSYSNNFEIVLMSWSLTKEIIFCKPSFDQSVCKAAVGLNFQNDRGVKLQHYALRSLTCRSAMLLLHEIFGTNILLVK
jgi:hypothetical protein